jgi:hypothetical protein
MGNTAQQAYDAIKNLEAQGKLPLPEPAFTKFVGSFNAASGKFGFAIPTTVVTTTETVQVAGKPHVIKQTHTVGQVRSDFAVDLLLKFIVQNPKGPSTVRVGATSVTVPAGQTSITVDVGNMISLPGADGTLPVFPGSISSGSASAEFQLQIIRAPLITAGAFTIPALPLVLIYAPPPGAQNTNFAEYSTSTATTRKLSSTVSSTNSTKTADALSTSDFATKVSGLLGSLAKVEQDNKEFGAAANSIGFGLGLLAAIFPDTSITETGALTTTTQHDLVTTDTDTTTFGTPPGLGPGVGDRFVYLRNVKIVWLIADNNLSYTVLGVDGIRAFAAQQLLSDAAAIASSSGKVTAGPVTGLDADTLQKLLALDPFVGNPSPALLAPRFVQNDPASAGGSGTDNKSGDTFTVTHDISETDTSTQTSTSTTIVDFKPGWLTALFGEAQATENQMTFTSTLTTQQGTDQKQTATVTFFAAPTDPPYLVGLFFDRLFGTFAFTAAAGSTERTAVVSPVRFFEAAQPTKPAA